MVRSADAELAGPDRQAAKVQKEYLRSIPCSTVCSAEQVQPEPQARWPDASQVTGRVDRSQLIETVQNGETPDPEKVARYINAELEHRILILDGSISVRIEDKRLEEADYRGQEFQDWQVSLKGDDEALVFTRPELIVDIHKEFLDAGADICRTNTFNCNAISQSAYGLQFRIYELNKAAAQLAKRATAEVTKQDAAKPRFVAGVVGPTTYSLSQSCSSADSVSRHASLRNNSFYVGQSHAPECKQYGTTTDRFGHVGQDGPFKGKYFSSRAWREMQMWPSAKWPDDGVFNDVTFDEMLEVYLEQICGLMDGGVDMLIFEGMNDTLNVKAAIYALEVFYEQFGKERVPLVINATISSSTGRMPSGQSIEAFFISVKHAKPIAVGIDGCDATEMRPFDKRLSSLCSTFCCACPTSSPTFSPSTFATNTLSLEGCNFVGGGSGTLPAHITELALKAAERNPRRLVRKTPVLMLAGLDPFVASSSCIHLIGQRCNLMGGKQFRELAYECKFHSALEVCEDQIQCGADVLDVNFDSTWEEFDAHSAMTTFLSFLAADPNVARVPLMVGSHVWPIIEAGLKHVQGKSIISAIGLTLGEDKFLLAAEKARRLGAALVIRAMEQDSRGESYEDKVRICEKSYKLLRSRLDFPAEDIIFDCHLQPLGFKGSKATRGIDFINAVEQLKRTCPDVSFIVGLGNLSLPFRWIPELRKAMHSVFLKHAIARGLNFAMVEPGELPKYNEISPEVLKACEDVIMNENSSDDVVSRFQSLAGMMAGVPVPSQLTDLDPSSQAQVGTYVPEAMREQWQMQAIQPLSTVIQSAAPLNASSPFQMFGTKAHASWQIHRNLISMDVTRHIAFSSISAWMGQGASGPFTGASCILDSYALWNRAQMAQNTATTVQWGPIGDIGLRRQVYGSRDVFAQFDIGQKLIGAADTASIERAILTSNAPEFLSIAYINEKMASEWEGKAIVKVRDTENVLSFKIRKTTPLARLVDAYLRQKNVRGIHAQLSFKGKAIDEAETVASMKLEDEAVLDAVEYELQ